jgi:hypothetical protein
MIVDQAETPGANGWAQTVCVGSVEILDSVDAATVTLRSTSRAQELLGASNEWVAGLGQTQYTLGEGPGVEAFTTGGPVFVADLAERQNRWPGFAEAALALGVAAVFAFPLQVGGIGLGTLELFRRHPGSLPAAVVDDAALLAELATSALLDQAVQVERGEAHWARPFTSYEDVNMATGMLAAQLRISLDDAFARLRAHAYTTNRPVVEVAQDVLRRRIPLDELSG